MATQRKVNIAEKEPFEFKPVNQPIGIRRKISVTGLGYVGLMIASAFAKIDNVIGFDVSAARIDALKQGRDINNEVSAQELQNIKLDYTTNANDLAQANLHIIAVPTPLDDTHHPDLTILLKATEVVAQHLKKGDIVVYESSVYPGATEEKCIPLLEKVSGLVCGKDFGVGYSPERINPADKEHTLANIPKIISATDKQTLDIMADVYNTIVKAGVYRASSIRVAEATKVIENIQRDVNISLVNEVALILHTLKMDSAEVFAAMSTKWNALPFKPGLVGGHCIPINSYYLAHKAEEAGFHPELILTARYLNEQMPKFIADTTIKEMIRLGLTIKGARIAVLGLSYKDNTPDVHDSRSYDLIQELQSFGTEILVHDPLADSASAKSLYDIELKTWDELTNIDTVILVVGHNELLHMDMNKIKQLLQNKGLLIDVTGKLDPEEFKGSGITLWRL